MYLKHNILHTKEMEIKSYYEYLDLELFDEYMK